MSEYAGLKNRLKRVRAPGWPSENPDGAEAVKAIEKLQSQVERLKGVLEKIGECDHERVTKEVYRRDGAHSKLDKCDHGRRMYEDCDECTAAFARSALEAKP